MNTAAPKIGFDRFIKGEWATMAVKVRVGQAEPGDVMALLESDGLSLAARKKTRTVLNRLWLEPRDELVDFANRGVALYQGGASVSVLHWGVAIATYPFFAHVAEMVGRLTAIQGDCATTEVHRRMSERYGEREGTYRMTNMVLQSQADWRLVRRTETGKRLLRMRAIPVSGSALVGWVLEAAVRSAGRPTPISSLSSSPVLYPFVFDSSLAFAASQSNALEIRSAGARGEVVALS